jgi:hypothetical protein
MSLYKNKDKFVLNTTMQSNFAPKTPRTPRTPRTPIVKSGTLFHSTSFKTTNIKNKYQTKSNLMTNESALNQISSKNDNHKNFKA